jgi:hypothetical protein
MRSVRSIGFLSLPSFSFAFTHPFGGSGCGCGRCGRVREAAGRPESAVACCVEGLRRHSAAAAGVRTLAGIGLDGPTRHIARRLSRSGALVMCSREQVVRVCRAQVRAWAASGLKSEFVGYNQTRCDARVLAPAGAAARISASRQPRMSEWEGRGLQVGPCWLGRLRNGSPLASGRRAGGRCALRCCERERVAGA